MRSAETGAGRMMFELEMLEPRILLSGSPTTDLLAAAAVTTLTLPQHDDVGGIHQATEHKVSAAAYAQSAPEQGDGIFAGVKGGDLDLPDAKASSDVQQPSGSSATGSGDSASSANESKATKQEGASGGQVNATTVA